MPILDHQAGAGELSRTFALAEADLAALEQRIAEGAQLPLATTVEQALKLARDLLHAYIVDEGRKRAPDASAELLDVFKVLVKGEPAWTAIRDNCRELVYYRNCINMSRWDALPAAAGKMAVRTARHILLYVKTRCIREGRIAE
jgi:hypothetical protein